MLRFMMINGLLMEIDVSKENALCVYISTLIVVNLSLI